MLVRGAHDAPDLAEHAADAVEHVLALDRVQLHDRPLLVVERARLVDDLGRHGDLADVVQKRAELDAPASAGSSRSRSATASDSDTTPWLWLAV